MKLFLLAVAAALLSGCASHLVVKNSDYALASGVPFNAPILVKIETTTTYEKTAEATKAQKEFCTADTEESIEALPIGERFYATIDPSIFADGEFSIEFNDKGSVSKISLNSKASSGVDKAASFLSTVLPFVRAPKVAPSSAADMAALVPSTKTAPVAAEDQKAAYCLKKSVTKKIIGRVAVTK